jgi:hypothetical protein
MVPTRTQYLFQVSVPEEVSRPEPSSQRPVVDPVMIKIAESNTRTKVIML